MKKITRILCICTIIFFCAVSAHAKNTKPLYISVAASMTDAFKALIVAFNKEHPDIRVLANFASSGSLAKQLAQGAPTGLYVSANPKWMDFLLKKQVIAPGSDRIFAYNSLVFVGRKDLQITELTQLTELEKIGIGTPQTVPAGQYAKQALDTFGLYAQLQQGHKLVLAKDVRQALLYADRGEVDGAFVYKTDARLARHAKLLFAVPQELYQQVSYPMGLTRTGAESEDAQKLYAFITSNEARTILASFGFTPAP